MSDKDGITGDIRSREEEYFRRKDRELVEKMRNAAEADASRQAMERTTGIHDPVMLQELEALGFTPDTVSLLPLVPIVQMAWAEGGITPAERSLLVKLARERGIAEGSAADRLLSNWMSHEPSPEVFARATRLIRAMLDSGAPEASAMSADEVIKYAESIAAASGGILGIGRVSAEERATLSQIAEALKDRR